MERRAFSYVLVLLIVTATTSTANAMPNRWQLFKEPDVQTLPAPTDETAVIVFVLITDAGDLTGGVILKGFGKQISPIYDATSENLKFLSLIRRGLKVAIVIPPGNYLFQSGNVLAVNVVAGRTYYIRADDPVHIGSTKLMPVRNGGSGEWQFSSALFREELEKSAYMVTHPVSREYYGKKNWATKPYYKMRDNLIEDWKNKTEEERQKFTLNPEDGIPVGYSLADFPSNQSTEAEQSITQVNMSQGKSVPSTEEPQLSEDEVSTACSEKLKALDRLRADGIFSELEYQKQKEKVLEGENC